MAHIKEPKGVDFVIASDPLTDEAREEISTFIREYKKKAANKKTRPTSNSKRSKTTRV